MSRMVGKSQIDFLLEKSKKKEEERRVLDKFFEVLPENQVSSRDGERMAQDLKKDSKKIVDDLMNKYGSSLPEVEPEKEKQYLESLPQQVEEMRKKMGMNRDSKSKE